MTSDYINTYDKQKELFKHPILERHYIELHELLFQTKLYLVKNNFVFDQDLPNIEDIGFQKHDEKLSRIVDEIKQKYNLANYELAEILVTSKFQLSLISFSTKKRELFQLFHNKRNEIILEVNNDKELDTPKFLNKIEEYTFLDLSNELPSFFYKTENLIFLKKFLNHCIYDSLKVNHKKALNKYEEIKTDKNNSHVYNLLDGL